MALGTFSHLPSFVQPVPVLIIAALDLSLTPRHVGRHSPGVVLAYPRFDVREKAWSEANQKRKPNGQFDGTVGGSGGGSGGGSASDSIEQEIVDNRKFDPSSWYIDDAKAPWNKSEAELRNGDVPGVKVDDRGGRGDHILAANNGSGEITVYPGYFRQGVADRKILIEHEVGHDVQRALTKQGREGELLAPWKTGDDSYDLPWLGSSNMRGHEALAWSYNELWDGVPAYPEKRELLSQIAATAQRMDLPVPAEWGGVAKSFKAWSEANQLRKPNGQFDGTIGGGGSGAVSGAEAEEPDYLTPGELVSFNREHNRVLTGEQIAYMQAYSSDGYKDVNKVLRTGDFQGYQDDWMAQFAVMDSAFVPAPRDMVVHRGLKLSDDFSLGVGDSFVDPAYLSTTASITVAEDFGTRLELTVPKGSPVFPMNGDSAYPAEAELIVGRGARVTVTGGPFTQHGAVYWKGTVSYD